LAVPEVGERSFPPLVRPGHELGSTHHIVDVGCDEPERWVAVGVCPMQLLPATGEALDDRGDGTLRFESVSKTVRSLSRLRAKRFWSFRSS
jgi:hypothetical protein